MMHISSDILEMNFVSGLTTRNRSTRYFNFSPASVCLLSPRPLSLTCCEWTGKTCPSCSSGQTCKAAPPAWLQNPPSSSFCKLHSSTLKTVFVQTAPLLGSRPPPPFAGHLHPADGLLQHNLRIRNIQFTLERKQKTLWPIRSLTLIHWYFPF